MTTREYMAAKLKEFRKACGLSAVEVGRAVGKSDKTISAWEVGRGQPDADLLVMLCHLYSVDISDFYPDQIGHTTELSEDESHLIDTYRHLNERDKQVVMTLAESLEGDDE